MPGHRSLVLHRGTARSPLAMLRPMLARVDETTLPEEPVAELERRIAELLGTTGGAILPQRHCSPQ